MKFVWARWAGPQSVHAAHLHVDGEQACHIQHGKWTFGKGHPVRMERVDVTEHGVPYGRACARCLRAWERLKRKAVS